MKKNDYSDTKSICLCNEFCHPPVNIFQFQFPFFPFPLPLPLAIQYLHSAFPSFTSTWHWIVFLCRIAESLTLAALQMLDRLRRHLSLEKSTSPAPIIRHVSPWTETRLEPTKRMMGIELIEISWSLARASSIIPSFSLASQPMMDIFEDRIFVVPMFFFSSLEFLNLHPYRGLWEW